MLADKTNTYENKQVDQKLKKSPLDLQYQSQTYEKTKSLIGEELDRSFDTEVECNSKLEVQRSVCLQESEIQRLSQAYADKYYYEMKFEQYQNLLAQQQQTIGKLLNEKKELQGLLVDHQKSECETQTEDDVQEEFRKYREESENTINQYRELVKELNSKLEKSQSKQIYEDIAKQMNEIKEQNNYLFEQLNQKEQCLEQDFANQVSLIEERLNQEKGELQEELENQLQLKDEEIHQQELAINELNSQIQQLYSDNLQLQNQLDLLNSKYGDDSQSSYQEDIQQQANLLQEQVQEYKVVINNLENQLFMMNAEIQRRGRSSSKDGRLISNYIKFNYQQRPSNEMTFASITPNGKKY